MYDELMVLDYDRLINFSDKEFFSNFAFIMQSALVRDVSLYTDLIDEMYEICERDSHVLKEIIERASKVRELVIISLKDKKDTPSPLSFGYTVSEALKAVLKDRFSTGEYISLGCVAESYLSYKKNWLNKDEYYEIRDMFVPFYLPISVEMLDIEAVLNEITKNILTNPDGLYTMVLLKKIGKTVVDKTISLDDFKDALNELNFDEAW